MLHRIMLLALPLLACALLAVAPLAPGVEAPKIDLSKLPPAAKVPVDFAKDVQPLLARCTACHGAEKQESGLRLHHKAEAMAGGDGGAVIVPGKSAESRLLHHVAGLIPDSQMPPPGEGEPLSAAQIGLLRAWIDAGATWPDSAAGVATKSNHWAYQPVRHAAPPEVKDRAWPKNDIDRFILARLEKEGLKPSAELDRPRLLRRVSLDLIGLPPTLAEVDAFVADTRPDAYERVVDRLLASPHYGERWARMWLDLARYADTHGFEKDPRRNMSPYRDWVIKALNANMPFDQFTIEQLAGDLLPNATLDQQVATGFHRNTMINTEGGIDGEEYRIAAVVDRVNTTATVWLGTTLACAQCHSHKYDPLKQKEYYQFLAFFNNTTDSGGGTAPEIDVDAPQAAAIRAKIAATEKELSATTAEFTLGQTAWEKTFQPETVAADAAPVDPSAKKAREHAAKKLADAKAKLPAPVREALEVAADKRTEKQQAAISAHYRTISPELKPARDKLAELQKELALYSRKTMVLREQPKPRETHIHLGGNFMAKGDVVKPGVPAVLPPLAKTDNLTRLDLARWLVDPANPLTPRVAANRYWEQLFGNGIVLTSEDFGTRGEAPSHPELLDYLAGELVKRKWDTKALQRLIVTSATYRQTSRSTPDILERDPYNRLLARGPRFRLEAEAVRDQALTISGLLSRKIGGPSVMPPQPNGVWVQPYSGDKWATSAGDDKYRRALYTFWRRTAPYPALMSFDAPSREFCVVRRPRTNTPLQALNVMNDPVYLEAAQALARRMLLESTDRSPQAIAALGWRLCLSRAPQPAEVERLTALFQRELEAFQTAPQEGAALLKSASAPLDSPAAAKLDPAAWAAWTVIANVLLNLDELITRG